MPDGEVAVRQHNQTHAIRATSLDGTVTVDVDEGTVHLPADFGAVYHEDRLGEDGEPLPDGGEPARTQVEMRGYGLGEDATTFSLVGSAIVLAGSGYLWGLESVPGAQLFAMLAFSAACLLGYVGARSLGGETHA